LERSGQNGDDEGTFGISAKFATLALRHLLNLH